MLRNVEDIIQRDFFNGGEIIRTPPTLQLYFHIIMANKKKQNVEVEKLANREKICVFE